MSKRDEHSARLIQRWLKGSPRGFLYVVYGELHLSDGHLPNELEQVGVAPEDLVLVHQNIDQLYFRLSKSGLDLEHEVLALNSRTFCILNTTPWVKWQSYLQHLESSFDQELDGGTEHSDFDSFVELTRWLQRELGVKVRLSGLHFLSANGEALEKMELFVPKILQERARRFVLGGRSFLIPETSFAYLGRSTLNHASSLAGQWIIHQLGGIQRTLWDMPRDFNKLIWIETLGFFCSKLVNPKRRVETIRDLKIAVFKGEQREEILKLCLQIRQNQIWPNTGVRTRRVRPRRKSSFFEAAKIMSALYGEQLYRGYRNGHISRRDVLRWMGTEVDGPSFEVMYLNVMSKTIEWTVPLASREERL